MPSNKQPKTDRQYLTVNPSNSKLFRHDKCQINSFVARKNGTIVHIRLGGNSQSNINDLPIQARTLKCRAGEPSTKTNKDINLKLLRFMTPKYSTNPFNEPHKYSIAAKATNSSSPPGHLIPTVSMDEFSIRY